MLKTPILFLIFNRPDTTRQVFNEIKKARPEKLYVAADGPRKEKEGEEAKCQATREIIKQIDWKCDVQTLFREKNLGCKIAVSSALDWFFENVEEGIILEDDCLPVQSFFRFCEELLNYYRNDKRIMGISGDNFQNGQKRSNGTYYFSKYPHIWGWATWKRAWVHYDVEMKNFPIFKEEKRIRGIFDNIIVQAHWLSILQDVYNGNVDTWDYQWYYTVWEQNGLCILPEINLVSNLGFGEEATHTAGKNNKMSDLKTYEIKEIIHTTSISHNKEADDYTSINILGIKNENSKYDLKNEYILQKSLLKYLKEISPLLKGNLLNIESGIMPFEKIITSNTSDIIKYITMNLQPASFYYYMKADIIWNGKNILLSDNAIDFVISFESIKDCSEPEKLMSEINRILKPGGTLFFTTSFLSPIHNIPYDKYRYTPFSLKQILENTGFRNIKLKALGGAHASLAQIIDIWIKRRAKNKFYRSFINPLLSILFSPLIRLLYKIDNSNIDFKEGCIFTGLAGSAIKPEKETM